MIGWCFLKNNNIYLSFSEIQYQILINEQNKNYTKEEEKSDKFYFDILSQTWSKDPQRIV